MRSPAPPRLPCWLLESVLQVRYGREVVGDLIEEYHRRAGSTPALELTFWFWSQTFRSLPSLVWASMRDREWPLRTGVALGVYLAMVIFRLSIGAAVSNWIRPGEQAVVWVAPILFLATTSIGGWVTACILREATIYLALMVLMSVVVLIAIQVCTVPVPWWYPLGFLTLGPAAVLLTPAIMRTTRGEAR